MNDIEEITITLTRRCNLNCKFCNVIYDSKYNDDLTVESVLSKYSLIEPIITNTCKRTINIVLMGGELFSDDIDDSIIDAYHQLLNQCADLCKNYNKRLTISLMTNLITKRVDRIIKLAKSFKDCDVHGSFDFVGRFDNDKLICLWWTNARAIKAGGVPFFASVVGHKYNIERIVNHDLLWINLYNEFGVYVQYYEPNGIANDYNVSYEAYGDFLIFLYDHYRQEKFLQSVINAYQNRHKTCCQSNWIDNSGSHKCCDHQKVIRIYKTNHQCFTCDHYNKCPLVCPRAYYQNSDCIFKRLFDHHLTKTNAS